MGIDLVLCESADGWSLHAPESTDEDIASGAAPCLLSGEGEPTEADYAEAMRALVASCEWSPMWADVIEITVIDDGWFADDGNAEVHYRRATSGAEAAQDYVDDGDWGEREETDWVKVRAWRAVEGVDAEGNTYSGVWQEDTHTVELPPNDPTPDCEHDWQEYEPVRGHGAGVIYSNVCMRCGLIEEIDTYAQNPLTGEQGLTSVRYSGDEEEE